MAQDIVSRALDACRIWSQIALPTASNTPYACAVYRASPRARLAHPWCEDCRRAARHLRRAARRDDGGSDHALRSPSRDVAPALATSAATFFRLALAGSRGSVISLCTRRHRIHTRHSRSVSGPKQPARSRSFFHGTPSIGYSGISLGDLSLEFTNPVVAPTSRLAGGRRCRIVRPDTMMQPCRAGLCLAPPDAMMRHDRKSFLHRLGRCLRRMRSSAG